MKYSYTVTRRTAYLCNILQAVSINVPPVLFIVFQETYGVGYAQLGTLVLIEFFLQICVDAVLSRIGDKVNLRFLMSLCGGFTVAGYALMALAPSLFPGHVYTGLVIAALFYATGSGIIEVMANPIIAALPEEKNHSNIGLLHAFYCWGQLGCVLLTTLLLKLLGQERWRLILVFWMVLPVLLIYLFLTCPLPDLSTRKDTQAGTADGSRREKQTSLLWRGVFWAAMIIMVSSGASEQAVAQWASLFAQKGLNVDKTLGDLFGPCFFALMMGIGRTIFGLKASKLNIKNCFLSSAALCVASYLLTAFSPSPVLSLLGLGLCGFSVAIMWPGTLILAGRAMPDGGTGLYAMLALGGDIGCSLGPWISGMVSEALQKSAAAQSSALSADQFALRGGVLSAIIFPVLLLVFVPILTSAGNARPAKGGHS